jgi:hypothetical protein
MSLSEKLSSVVDRDAPGSGDGSDPLDRPDLARRFMAQGDEYAIAKQYVDAEASFYRALEHKRDFAPAYNNLGWVRQMLGDAEGAELRYRQALHFDPTLRGARKNLLMLLVKSGRRKESFQLWRDELTSDQNPAIFLEEQVSRALRDHNLYLAGEYAALLSAFRWGSKWHPAEADAGRAPAFLMEQAVFLTIPKLMHDVEQFSYLQRKQILGREFTPIISAYEKVIDELKSDGAPGPTRLNEDLRARIGYVYNRIIHIRPTPRVSRALSDEWDPARVETDYLDGDTGVVVLDNFLSKEALENVRLFCLDSTVWSGNRYNHGRLGAFFHDGFNCPLLLQIAEELQDALPRVIGRRYPLQQLWGFKTGQTLPADSTTHADFAAVNVNFWITPDDANLDKESGGLIVYDVQAPLNWDFDSYNGKLGAIGSFLHRKKASSFRIPYRQNRAIIFNSDLFHATEAVHFRPGYENHRVNVTMLYGLRENDVHHLDERIDSPTGVTRSGSAGWRSAAFGR